MNKLSIIIIIYKVEKYLRQCIDSVLSQTFSDFELILVDDGSPDQCPKICDEYAAKDERIKVIHQSNQGPVKARWNGILESKGKYISLLDSDDWLEPDMYEKMMYLAFENNVDIVITGYKEEREGVVLKKRNRIESGIYTADKMEEVYRRALYDNVFYEPGIIPAVWNKLIRRDLFFDHFAPVDSEIRMGEDASVIYPVIARSKSLVIENEICSYHYRVIEGSMSNSYDVSYFDKAIRLLLGLKTNCSCESEMTKNIIYYALFISQIGIQRLLSRKCNYSLRKKMAILIWYKREYERLELDSFVCWGGFSKDSKLLLKAFLDSNCYRVFGCFLLGRARRRLNMSTDQK